MKRRRSSNEGSSRPISTSGPSCPFAASAPMNSKERLCAATPRSLKQPSPSQWFRSPSRAVRQGRRGAPVSRVAAPGRRGLRMRCRGARGRARRRRCSRCRALPRSAESKPSSGRGDRGDRRVATIRPQIGLDAHSGTRPSGSGDARARERRERPRPRTVFGQPARTRRRRSKTKVQPQFAQVLNASNEAADRIDHRPRLEVTPYVAANPRRLRPRQASESRFRKAGRLHRRGRGQGSSAARTHGLEGPWP